MSPSSFIYVEIYSTYFRRIQIRVYKLLPLKLAAPRRTEGLQGRFV